MAQGSVPRRYLVAGVIVITVALWLLATAMGLGVPPLSKVWPLFILLGGVASIVDYFIGSRASGSLGKGIAGIGLGLLFFGFTSGAMNWRNVGEWWGAIPLIIGVACLVNWFVGGRKTPGLLIGGVIGVGLGMTGLADHFEWLDRFVPSPLVLWAVLLLALGVYLVVRSLGQKKSGAG